jgi:hypothetical protein
MRKNSSPTVPVVLPPAVTRISSIEELTARCEAPLVARFTVDGNTLEVLCRRLTPAEEEKIASIGREIQPPLVKGRTPEEDRYDLANPVYQAKKSKAASMERALTIYEGCPIVKAGKPMLSDREAIWMYVQNLFSNTVLEILYLTIQQQGVKLAETVNFTLPPGSEN